MKVFVAGATGAIGKRLVPQPVAAGYQVVGMTQEARNIEQLRTTGAEPVMADALDRGPVIEAITRTRPELVVQ